MNKLFGKKQLILVFLFLFLLALGQNTTGITTPTTMAAAGGNAPLAPHMRPCALRRRVKWMGDNPPSLGLYFGGGSRVFMDLKALLCSGNDDSPQHRSVLRTVKTLNSPQNYIRLLGGFSSIHSMRQRRAKGLMWGARRSFLLAAAMVGYGGCVG